jgi:hypothetical protein
MMKLEAPFVLVIPSDDEPIAVVWTFHTLREALDFDAPECRRYFLHGEAARDWLAHTTDRRHGEMA